VTGTLPQTPWAGWKPLWLTPVATTVAVMEGTVAVMAASTVARTLGLPMQVAQAQAQTSTSERTPAQSLVEQAEASRWWGCWRYSVDVETLR